MSKLLVTRLPLEMEENVRGDTYNRLVRVLELNLGEFDPATTRQINATDKGQAQFNAGSLVWNTNNQSLEVYTGNEWVTISTPQEEHGFSATASVGAVTVNIAGSTTITL